MFTLFCIFNVIWHAKWVEFSVINICNFSNKKIIFKKETIYLLILRDLSYVLLYIWYCPLKIKSSSYPITRLIDGISVEYSITKIFDSYSPNCRLYYNCKRKL